MAADDPGTRETFRSIADLCAAIAEKHQTRSIEHVAWIIDMPVTRRKDARHKIRPDGARKVLAIIDKCSRMARHQMGPYPELKPNARGSSLPCHPESYLPRNGNG